MFVITSIETAEGFETAKRRYFTAEAAGADKQTLLRLASEMQVAYDEMIASQD